MPDFIFIETNLLSYVYALFNIGSSPPGTGKTMMAKAVANATTASFITMVGSEFVQKYLGEGNLYEFKFT